MKNGMSRRGPGGSKDDKGERMVHQDARKYEDCEKRNHPSALGMAAAVELQNAIGEKNIEARVRELSCG